MPPTVASIIAATAKVTEIDAKEIKGPSRKRRVSWARQVACAVAKYYGYSYQRIGRRLNDRDHTTILYAVKMFSLAKGDRLKRNSAAFEAVLEELNDVPRSESG